MKNNKGQALVEFIIILPVLLLIILAIIDFGNIISKKYALENDIDTISEMYESNDKVGISKYLNNIDVTMNIEEETNFTKIILTRNIKITSPLVNVILGKNYKISVFKSIYNGATNEK